MVQSNISMQRLVRQYSARNPGEDLPESWQADKACAAAGSEPPSLGRNYPRKSGGAAAAFKQADRVEAYWPDDDNWYPARIVRVTGKGVFCIKFDGFPDRLEVSSRDLRIPVQCDAFAEGRDAEEEEEKEEGKEDQKEEEEDEEERREEDEE